MNMKPFFRVLVVDDDPTVQSVVRLRLERKGHEVLVAGSGTEALEKAPAFKPEVLVSDVRMPGMDGFEVLARFQELPAILITGHGDKESAIKAVEAGVFAFFEKPFDLDSLEVAVRRAGERSQLLREKEALLKRVTRLARLQGRELESFRDVGGSPMVGTAPALERVREILVQLARKPHAPLLINGETGTGKEIVAKELHRLSFDKPQSVPFLALNCATVPQELFESELFGHEKGSFSGAHASRIGLAEAVQDGTLFLDEIGEMDPRHQAKLLRFLQERSFRRVGANREISFRGRIVAATHRDLKALVAAGKFREDLYFRLHVVAVELPPLRERHEDLEELSERLAAKFSLKGVLHPEELATYPWPGNIRELQNWIERAALLELHNDEGWVTAPLPHHEGSRPRLSGASAPAEVPGQSLQERRKALLETFDRAWIQEALDAAGGQVATAARALDIDRKNLARRMQELGIMSGTAAKQSRKKAA
jgi:DNA-binding NtrC family response regulator